ncbi:hypothetical protein BS78_02G115300 [Paspalum vaginatum]|nr:hypothetical protein BS78_02G115300 [Paspalum vaginatum]
MFPCAMSQEDASSSLSRGPIEQQTVKMEKPQETQPAGDSAPVRRPPTPRATLRRSITGRRGRTRSTAAASCACTCRARRSMQQQQSMSLSEAEAEADTRVSTDGPGGTRSSTVSKAPSMERFKYSSSSSALRPAAGDAEDQQRRHGGSRHGGVRLRRRPWPRCQEDSSALPRVVFT